jgi:hypothetical protein
MVVDPVVLGTIILVSLTSTYILVSKDWRFCIGALALQYIGVFLLVRASWPAEMAVTKMVSGWMAGAILGIAMMSATDQWLEAEKFLKSSLLFRLMAVLILAVTITSLVLNSESWLSSIQLTTRWGSFILISMGLLQLSLTSHPLRVIIGILTSLSGFEILYAAIETSILVTGLLAGINLGLALVGAYLLISPTMERS